jgi:hypothetical protein
VTSESAAMTTHHAADKTLHGRKVLKTLESGID